MSNKHSQEQTKLGPGDATRVACEALESFQASGLRDFYEWALLVQLISRGPQLPCEIQEWFDGSPKELLRLMDGLRYAGLIVPVGSEDVPLTVSKRWAASAAALAELVQLGGEIHRSAIQVTAGRVAE